MDPSNRSLYGYFKDFAEARGNDEFIFDEKKSYTVMRAFNAVKALAKQFADCGIKKGECVSVSATRTVNTVLVFYALLFMGATAVMFDPRDELTGDIIIAGDRLYVRGEERELDFDGETSEVFAEVCGAEETSTVIFTSGSTGGKKAVKLGQYNFINNSLDTKDIGGYRADDRNIVIVPVFHVFGIALIVTAVVTKHAVFVPERVDTEYVLDCMERYGITRLNGVPSMYAELAKNKGARKLKLNCGLIGGGPYTKEQFLFTENTLGITLVPVYGMSECVGISCGSYSDSLDRRCDGVGRVYSMNKVEFTDDGEILVKSPAAAVGYVDGNTKDEDGWIHTGDLGYFDEDGYLHISGRKKDIIIRNGNNLSAVDIERKILSLPSVKDVCVVGILDERAGEVPCAMIVSDKEVDCATVLRKIELPEKVAYEKSIPLTSTGKPDKQKVKEFFDNGFDKKYNGI